LLDLGFSLKKYHQECAMPLSDLLIRHAVYQGTPSGDKYPDLYGMYLLVTRTGKYWRLNYRHAGKQRPWPWASTLA
jgi:hypothetical protein